MVLLITLTPIYQKLPYDKAAMPVKRIDAFQIGGHGRGAVLFDPYILHAPLPEVIASETTGRRAQKGPDPTFKVGGLLSSRRVWPQFRTNIRRVMIGRLLRADIA